MGRLQVRQTDLARRLGENDEWLSKRLRAVTPINLNEMQRIATALGVGVRDLLPQDGGTAGRGVTRKYLPGRQRVVATIGEPRKPSPVRVHRPGRPVTQTRPIGRVSNRPVTPVAV